MIQFHSPKKKQKEDNNTERDTAPPPPIEERVHSELKSRKKERYERIMVRLMMKEESDYRRKGTIAVLR